ncbi:hypothetical protein JOB18_002175 [Solea senegalensis]|uniref:Uncharacterized protein n=1 Tax=Solea senegalensis TaxID=28829 RepID=A0AAV6S4X0_SOLSE|nr:hypothetical protein JOB18_002175 [Solea senegalensis]
MASPIPAAPSGPGSGPTDPPEQAAPSQAVWTRAAVPKLEEGDDIEQYLTTFERLAVAYPWPRAEWAVYLVPYLTGRACSAYVAMDIQEAGVVEGLSQSVVLGQDVPILPELVQSTKPVSMVATRSQAKAKTELLHMMPFSQNGVSLPEKVKERNSHRQRRREKLQGTVWKLGDQVPVPDVSQENVWEIPSNFSELQKEDQSLQETFSEVTEIDGKKTGVAAALSGEH